MDIEHKRRTISYSGVQCKRAYAEILVAIGVAQVLQGDPSGPQNLAYWQRLLESVIEVEEWDRTNKLEEFK